MPTSLITIDPGLEKVAFAEWDLDTGRLHRAGLVQCKHGVGMERAEKWREMAFWVGVELGFDHGDKLLVLEVPQVYGGPQKTDPNDLIDLAGVLGAIAGNLRLGEVVWSPLPREWKGQLPKEVSQKRVESRLSATEKKLIQWPAKSLRHNVYDAIHLGLVYLEREGRREISLPQRYPAKV